MARGKSAYQTMMEKAGAVAPDKIPEEDKLIPDKSDTPAPEKKDLLEMKQAAAKKKVEPIVEAAIPQIQPLRQQVSMSSGSTMTIMNTRTGLPVTMSSASALRLMRHSPHQFKNLG